MLAAFIAGYFLGLSLIVAIGAQNAFVLKQGLLRQHVFAIVLFCALSDAALIVIGVGGFAWLEQGMSPLVGGIRLLGALYLAAYGLYSLWQGLRVQHALHPAEAKGLSLKQALLMTLAFTWLNPHVYLDTVLLLGSASSAYAGQAMWFGSGAVLASFSFFFALGYGARLLQPWFAQPQTWRWLDSGIGVLMLYLAYTLLNP